MDGEQLLPTDTAYIAGLIDGEGTIPLTRNHQNENRQLAFSISNTDRALLEFVHATIGVSKITGKRIAQSHHTPGRGLLQALREHDYGGKVAVVAREEVHGTTLKKLGVPTVLYPMNNAVDYAVGALSELIHAKEKSHET